MSTEIGEGIREETASWRGEFPRIRMVRPLLNEKRMVTFLDFRMPHKKWYTIELESIIINKEDKFSFLQK